METELADRGKLKTVNRQSSLADGASSERRRSVVGALSSSERVHIQSVRSDCVQERVRRFHAYLHMNASRPNRNTRARRASRSDFLPLPSPRSVSLRRVPTVHVFTCVIFSALLLSSMRMNSDLSDRCRHRSEYSAHSVYVRFSPRTPWLSPHECIAPKSE